jgi:hypothetical protein
MAEESAEASAPVDVGDATDENDAALPRRQSALELQRDATLPGSQGCEQLCVGVPERDQRDAPVRGGSDHGVGAPFQRDEGLAEGGTGRCDVSADEHRMTGKRARSPGDTGQALAEGGAALWDPEGVLVVGKKTPPGGPVLWGSREDQSRAATASRLTPADGKAREEVRALRAETLLASLSARLPGEQHEVPVHCPYLTSAPSRRIYGRSQGMQKEKGGRSVDRRLSTTDYRLLNYRLFTDSGR